jgi:hypothetical protein
MLHRIMLITAFGLLVAAAMAGVGTSAGNGIVSSATGSGQSTFGGEQRTFTLTDRLYSDGTAAGELQLDNRAQGRKFHMTLDCLVVSGNKAWASGTVDRSTITSDVGTEWDVEVVDNGEGANAPPDQISLVSIFSPTQLPCTNPAVQAILDTLTFPIESGNIQVR